MTPKEQKIWYKNFEARRTSRITHLQSGYETVFGFPPNQVGSGWTSAEGSTEDPDLWRQSIDQAVNYIEQALGQTRDTGIGEALATVLRTCNALKRVPNGALQPQKARPSPNGSTEPLARHVSSNQISKRSHTVSASELSDDLEEKIMKLTAKMRRVSAR
jgi:hypothetical protein